MTTKIDIIIDTREKKPLFFEDYDAVWQKDVLPAGDYTIVGHDLPGDDESIIIERKQNVSEFIGNVGKHWDRFTTELDILAQYDHKAIIVCSENDIADLIASGRTRLSLNFYYKRLADIQIHWGVPVIFMRSRRAAEHLMFRMFVEAKRKHKALD